MIPRSWISCLLCSLVLFFTLPETNGQASLVSSRFRTRRSASDYLSAASSVDSRSDKVLQQLYRKIEAAIPSVEGDIAVANRDRAILGLANWLGMTFGIAAATGGNPNIGQLDFGSQVQVGAQVLYGYGYWGPFLLEFEPARLDCSRFDLDSALAEYGFLTDMGHNYGYLESYSGSNPKDALSDVNDPIVLQYYAVELNHAMKRSIYCITSRKGSNQDALEVNTLIDLYTQLLTERLAMTNDAINEYSNHV